MPKRTHTLVVAATLAAIALAGTSTAAQAQVSDEHARRPPTQGQVGESWRHQTDVPAQPVEPGGLPSWVMASLGLLTAVLALAGGLTVRAARRSRRRARLEHAA
jgi:glucose/arabinose dehydrogenase